MIDWSVEDKEEEKEAIKQIKINRSFFFFQNIIHSNLFPVQDLNKRTTASPNLMSCLGRIVRTPGGVITAGGLRTVHQSQGIICFRTASNSMREPRRVVCARRPSYETGRYAPDGDARRWVDTECTSSPDVSCSRSDRQRQGLPRGPVTHWAFFDRGSRVDPPEHRAIALELGARVLEGRSDGLLQEKRGEPNATDWVFSAAKRSPVARALLHPRHPPRRAYSRRSQDGGRLGRVCWTLGLPCFRWIAGVFGRAVLF